MYVYFVCRLLIGAGGQKCVAEPADSLNNHTNETPGTSAAIRGIYNNISFTDMILRSVRLLNPVMRDENKTNTAGETWPFSFCCVRHRSGHDLTFA